MNQFPQSSAIPFRYKNNRLEILLITSIKKKRWIIPKGIIDEGMSAKESAAKEAFEEAGISGSLIPTCFGEYEYKKWGGICRVQVYALEVKTIFNDWPESQFRERKWAAANQITEIIGDKKILPAINRFIESQKSKK